MNLVEENIQIIEHNIAEKEVTIDYFLFIQWFGLFPMFLDANWRWKGSSLPRRCEH